jgi:hypothetical protein
MTLSAQVSSDADAIRPSALPERGHPAAHFGQNLQRLFKRLWHMTDERRGFHAAKLSAS